MHRCGLLLQMSHIVWSVCLCVGHMDVCCKKKLNQFGVLNLVGPRNHVLDSGQDQMNPFTATRGDKLAMRPFAKLLQTCVYHLSSWPYFR